MRFFCPKCGTRHNREDADIPPEGLTLPCEKCGFSISIKGKNARPGPSRPAAAFDASKIAPPVEEDDDDDDAFNKTVRVDSPFAATLQQMKAAEEKHEEKPARPAEAARGGTERPATASRVARKPTGATSPPAGERKPSAGVSKPPPESEPRAAKTDEMAAAKPAREPARTDPSLPEAPKAPAEPEPKPAPAAPAAPAARAAEPEKTPVPAPEPAPAAPEAKDRPAQPSPPAPLPTAPGGGRLARYLAFLHLGGGSGGRFRFRDLFFALAHPFDPRKLLAATAGIFAGSLLFSGLIFLGNLTHSGIGATVALILASLALVAATITGLAMSTRSAEQEMLAGRRLPFRESVSYVFSHLGGILGTPLLFVIAVLVFLLGVATLSWAGRIPVAGPILYGITFLGSFALGLLSVLAALALSVALFSYLPLLGSSNLSAVGGARSIFSFILKNPGRYLLHYLLAGLVAAALYLCLGWLCAQAFSVLLRVAGGLTHQDLGAILVQMPLLLLAPLLFGAPAFLAGAMAGGGGEWPEQVAGWLVGLGWVAILSFTLAFALVYFFGAGAVSFHLLWSGATNPREKK